MVQATAERTVVRTRTLVGGQAAAFAANERAGAVASGPRLASNPSDRKGDL